MFGCITYVHIPDELRSKLDPKAEKCIFVGYSLEKKGYMCYNPITCELRVSKDVVFNASKQFKVFGCITYVHIPDELHSKLDPKAEKCIFVGYSLEKKGYMCYNPITCELRVSKDVVFDEMGSCYGDVKYFIGVDVKEQVVAQNAGQK